jgi:hypothetical protein
MPLETASFIHELQPASPSGSDRVHQGDDHIRLVKSAVKATFPNFTGPLTLTNDFLNTIKSLLVPTGTISLWSGSEEAVPAGWAICKGQTVAKTDGSGNITLPDLRGKAPVGANDAFPLGQTAGQSVHTLTTATAGNHAHGAGTDVAGYHSHGGATAPHGLSVDQLPPHRHGNGVTDDSTETFVYGGVSAIFTNRRMQSTTGGVRYQGFTETVGSGSAHQHGIYNDGGHGHVVSIAADGTHAHNIPAFSVIQPSLGIHFIMKI